MTNGLNQSAISDIICDQNGILWIGTYGGGVNRLDPSSQTFLPLPEQFKKLNWSQVNCLKEDKLGRIWIGCYEGLAVYDPRKKTLSTLDTLPFKKGAFSVIQIEFDNENHAFLSTPFDGIYAYQLNSDFKLLAGLPFQVFKKNPEGLTFFFKMYAQKDEILACTQIGLLQFRLKNGKIEFRKKEFSENGKSRNFSGMTSAFLKDAAGRTWVAGGKSGYFLFDPSGNEIEVQFPYKGSFSGGKINDIFQDKVGGIWIGSTKGLSYTHPQLSKFNSYSNARVDEENGLNLTWSIYTDDDKNFLLGSEYGLYSFNTRTFHMEKIPFPGTQESKIIYSFLKTKTGKLLLGSSQGLFEARLVGGKYKIFKILPELIGLIGCMEELSDGKILIGCYDERGLYEISGDFSKTSKFQINPKRPTGLISSSINCMEKDDFGKVWIGTDKGLSLFDPVKKRFDNHVWEKIFEKGEFSPLVYDFANFKDELWIATFGTGIIIFNKERRTYSHLGLKEGLPNESVYQLQVQNEKVWASTNKGLCLIDKKNRKIRTFTEGDGLQSNEFNHFSSFKNKESQKIYFGGLYGFDEASSFLSPENNNLPKIAISKASIYTDSGKRELPIEKRIWELRPGEENLEIEFSALNYLMPEKNKYAYSYSSLKSERIELGEKSRLNLVKLQPGTFTLKIFASNNEELWNVKPLEIKIVVQPHFWKTDWFKALIALATIFILFLIARFYIKSRIRNQILILEKQQAVKQERSRISAEMHDDLGSGLTSIKMLSEVIKIKSGKGDDPELEKISSRSEELIDSLNTIVWALNNENDQLVHMAAYFRLFCKKQFEERGLDLSLEVKVDPEIESIEVSGELRRNIFLILKESTHNIFKHSGATHAYIKILFLPSGLAMEIKDNGKGANLGEQKIGNGLKNMKNRALAIGGKIEFKSENGFQVNFQRLDYN